MEPELLSLTSQQIVVPSHISRTFVQEHRNYIFVYGYDVLKRGILGQCWNFVGEPNAYEIPTLFKFCPSGKVFFNDSDSNCSLLIEEAIEKIAQQAFLTKFPVIPCPNIGKGCSRLFEIAPKTYAYLISKLDLIKYPNIKYIYK